MVQQHKSKLTPRCRIAIKVCKKLNALLQFRISRLATQHMHKERPDKFAPSFRCISRGDLLSLPSDRMRIPSELDLFLNGRIEGSPVVQDVARQDFQGSYGYVLE